MTVAAGASSKTSLSRGRRTPHDIKIETYPISVSDNMETDTGGASGDTTPTGDMVEKGTLADSPHSQKRFLDKIPFFSGIPSVEVTRGVLHLYKMK